MTHTLRTASLALALLILPVAACAQSADVHADAGPTDPALWRIADEDTTIYLFGSFHLLPAGIDWYKGDVREAFEASDELIVEVLAPEDGGAATVSRLSRAEDGTTLSQKVGEETADRLGTALQRIGVPLAAFEGVDPWYAVITLSVAEYRKLGFDPANGVEQTLMDAADQSGKPMGQLETFEQQLGFFETMPMPMQVDLLTDLLDELDELSSAIGTMVEDWREGDVADLAALMNDGMDDNPALRQRILTDRNRAWAQWIDDRLDEPGTVFVTVGAAHLAGAGSVQSFLAERDIAVERIE